MKIDAFFVYAWGDCIFIIKNSILMFTKIIMGKHMQKLLVLGVGNILLTDDGVGVWAAQELMKDVWPEKVSIIEAGTFTHDIFYIFNGFSQIFVLDVVHAHGAPGTIYQLSEEDLVQNENQRLSIHDIDLLDSLNMAKMLFGARPQLRIFGVEPYDYTTWNIGLSPDVQSIFSKYIQIVYDEIQCWLNQH